MKGGEDEKHASHDQHEALRSWWLRHCKEFSTWFLTSSEEERRAVLLEASPDMAPTTAATRQAAGEKLRVTDLLLPELNLEGLLAADGKLGVLFCTKRCVSKDRCAAADYSILNGLLRRQSLPRFDQGAFDGMGTVFVDPCDPEERVQAVPPAASAEVRAAVLAKIDAGALVEANVFLACKVRRDAIACFLEAIFRVFEEREALAEDARFNAIRSAQTQQRSRLMDALLDAEA